MHSLWTGAISFGLVNIPVKMYTASKDKEISFTMLHKKDLSEIRYARICKTEGKEVPWNEIVKGYEIENGNFVVFDDKDFEKINLKKSKTIEILHFVDEEEIDAIYYVKPYFLEPAKNGEKAYELLRDALKKSKKMGLAKYIIRTREHVGVIKFHENMIILNELRYESELLNNENLKIPPQQKANPKEMEMALQLIDQLTSPFTPSKYKDTYTEEVKQAIKQKAKGKPVHPKTQEAPVSKVHDIMSLLKASLETKPAKKSAKKTA
ncbi:MAG TPA: Ku protein [Parachlamydiaceae bacterium]|nr:Ku protein [Parachlamydiaceae bacterium]